MKDGQVKVLLVFSQTFDMVIHGLLFCKLRNLQNYLDGARMLVDSYLNSRTQFVRCGEKKSSVGRVTCGVSQWSVPAHTSFEVTRRLVLSLIFSHVNYGNIVFTGVDSQRRLGVTFKACLRYIHMR
jgi:hypothetical protein